MKKTRILLTICLLACLTFSAFAQTVTPVKWAYKTVKVNDSVAELQFTATIEPNWHLYAQKPGQGQIEQPLVFNFNKSPKYERMGKVTEPTPQSDYDDLLDAHSNFYSKQVTFKQRVKVKDDQPFTVQGKLEGQACIEGRCTPIEEKFSFDLKGFHPTVNIAVAEEPEEAEPADNAAVEPTGTPQTAEVAPATDKPADNAEEEESLLMYFLGAVLGGLVGLLMPCVFPMIPMTVSYFSKDGNTGKRNAMLYGLFIILIFVIFGLVLSLIFGADLGNVLSTHWIPNILFAVIFFIFALSLLGYFEITLPSSWVNGSAKRQNAGSVAGIFFMALTLVLVSFSCTLPIAGAVALNAAGGSFLKPVIGMLGFSLGIAVPFTLFALFPNMLKKLPKSGGWMNTLKVVLAFVELAFALKFINVPDQTYHWRILDREVYLSLWIVLFSMLGFYLLGKIKFPHDDDYPVQKSWFRFLLSVAVFSFVVYMVPGLFGAPLKAISGWLPPMTTQDFDISHIVRTESGSGGATASTYQMTEEPMYADKLEIPFGIKGYFDYDQALRVAKKEGKPVFLDFTGHGCTNCRNVENAVWIDPEVRRIFAEEVIVCTMYADDKVIPLPDEEKGKLTDANGDPITMLGAKNRYIEQTKYHENSQPCYFVVDPDGNVLSGPTYYERDKDKYIQFLRKGIDAYKGK
ncbi:MAG: thioredoxin family protein [Bacteroidales bacterium]|nr:thioredoxin family protein [Bacteroidales bacterium]